MAFIVPCGYIIAELLRTLSTSGFRIVLALTWPGIHCNHLGIQANIPDQIEEGVPTASATLRLICPQDCAESVMWAATCSVCSSADALSTRRRKWRWLLGNCAIGAVDALETFSSWTGPPMCRQWPPWTEDADEPPQSIVWPAA